MKVIPNEECVTQHKLLVFDGRIVKCEDQCKKFVPKPLCTNLSLDEASKKLAWKNYERLLNIEFPWSQNLPHDDPVAGPAQLITPYDILKSLRHMKNGKVAGPSRVVAEMLKAVPDICCKIIADLITLSYLRDKLL